MTETNYTALSTWSTFRCTARSVEHPLHVYCIKRLVCTVKRYIISNSAILWQQCQRLNSLSTTPAGRLLRWRLQRCLPALTVTASTNCSRQDDVPTTSDKFACFSNLSTVLWNEKRDRRSRFIIFFVCFRSTDELLNIFNISREPHVKGEVDILSDDFIKSFPRNYIKNNKRHDCSQLTVGRSFKKPFRRQVGCL